MVKTLFNKIPVASDCTKDDNVLVLSSQNNIDIAFKTKMSTFENYFMPARIINDLYTNLSALESNIEKAVDSRATKDVIDGFMFSGNNSYIIKQDAEHLRSKLLTRENLEEVLKGFITDVQLSVDMEEVNSHLESTVRETVTALINAGAITRNGLATQLVIEQGHESIVDALADTTTYIAAAAAKGAR